VNDYSARLEASRAATRLRADVVRTNLSLRASRLPTLPLPPKPEVVKVPVAYAADGTYEGRLERVEDLPPGCHIRWEVRR